jgi:uncharacterized protein
MGARRRGAPAETALARRLAACDWRAVGTDLDAWGYARLPGLLAADECRRLADCFACDGLFRSTVSMERHRFGAGSYRYFAAPLPPLVSALREALYPPLAAIANAWQQRLGAPERFPPTLAGFLGRCRAQGQTRPTPLLLRYGAGGFNNLHRDLYGDVAFPLQVTVLLSRPGRDFRGGEFLLVEQRARQQSRGDVVRLGQGDAVVFPTRERPVEGRRGTLRAELRHGVARVERGERTALGIIFHDAR